MSLMTLFHSFIESMILYLEENNVPLELPHVFEQGCDILQDLQILEWFLNLPRLNDHGNNPLNYKYLAKQQVEDEKLQQLAKGRPDNYVTKTLNGHKVLCYVKTHDNAETQWQIALLRQLVIPTIQYFHTILGHQGVTRMHLIIQTRYYHPMLRKEIDDFACNACQNMKWSGTGFGLLPEWDVGIVPWAEVAVDLIGPWTVKIRGKQLEKCLHSQ